MQLYPLFFNFTSEITGPTFKTKVTTEGRVLVEVFNEEWWINGVNPGSMAGGGPDLPSAWAKFRQSFNEILVDFAEEVPNHEAFEAKVNEFLADVDTEEARRWEEAREAMRQGGSVDKSLSRMKVIKDGMPFRLTFSRTEDRVAPVPKRATVGATSEFPMAADEQLELAA